jgi:hypothetical protein
LLHVLPPPPLLLGSMSCNPVQEATCPAQPHSNPPAMHSRHPSLCRRARSTLFVLIAALLLAAAHASQCVGGGGTCDAPEQQLQCASDPSLVLQVTCDICPRVRRPITTVCQYFSLDDAGRILLPPGINDVVLDVGQVRASPPPLTGTLEHRLHTGTAGGHPHLAEQRQ